MRRYTARDIDRIRLADAISRPRSLDAPVSAADDASTLGELLPAAGPSPEAVAEARERRELLRAALARLEPRERDLIVRRYLASPGNQIASERRSAPQAVRMGWEDTLADIGDRWGISRERTRQILLAALLRLRAILHELAPETWPGQPCPRCRRVLRPDDIRGSMPTVREPLCAACRRRGGAR